MKTKYMSNRFNSESCRKDIHIHNRNKNYFHDYNHVPPTLKRVVSCVYNPNNSEIFF